MAYAALPFRSEEHREALLRLWADNMSDRTIAQVLEPRMRWFYESNPLGPASTWVSHVVETGELVGCASLFPRRMQLLGEVVKAGVLCDFAVAKAHRIGGAAIAVQRKLAADAPAAGFSFLFGYPNQSSAAVCKRVGYVTVGETQTWVRPLRTAYRIAEVVKHPALQKLAAPTLDLGLAVADALRLGARPRSLRAAIEARADARYDRLWQRARARYDLVGEKTEAYLDWRYVGFTTKSYAFFSLTHTRGPLAGELQGYVVYHLEGEAVHIADLFCEDPERGVDVLLLSFVSAMREAGHRSVSITLCAADSWYEKLRLLLFVKRPGARSLVAHVEPPKTDADRVKRAHVLDRQRWLMLDGELDI